MKFNRHSEFEDTHAFFSPSQPYWLNYDKEKLIRAWDNRDAQNKGTRLHALVAEMIRCYKLYGTPSPEDFVDDTFGLYFRDACHFWMEPEVTLVYSDICYGHADTIQFYENERLLRIHDLKTGSTPAKFLQLETYAAQFFAEYGEHILWKYGIPVEDCNIELRIYQANDIQIENPSNAYILNEITGLIREKHTWLSEELDRRSGVIL